MSQVMDEQLNQFLGEGYMQAVAILFHPISGTAQLLAPPLQESRMTVGLMGSCLIAFLNAAGSKCEIYIDGKLMPYGSQFTMPKM
jgi:hypothetical protein